MFELRGVWGGGWGGGVSRWLYRSSQCGVTHLQTRNDTLTRNHGDHLPRNQSIDNYSRFGGC